MERDRRIMDWLRRAVESNASDLHLASSKAPRIRKHGEIQDLYPIPSGPFNIDELILEIMSESKKAEFLRCGEVDFSFTNSSIGRFRVNVFRQLNGISAVFRVIPVSVPTLEEISAPNVFSRFCEMRDGLVLISGPTGCGKSTTMAAMVDSIIRDRKVHVLTIEDPIEFIYQSQQGIISQRQLHDHTHSFEGGLKAALREDPDVILVGEMRDLATIRLAITVAETGHLVLSTLHTLSAAQSINRIIDTFPVGEQSIIRSMLSGALKGVVSQMLVPKTEEGRIAAWEIMMVTSAIRHLIRENKMAQMHSVIETGAKMGMQTMNQCLRNLHAQGCISRDVLSEYTLGVALC